MLTTYSIMCRSCKAVCEEDELIKTVTYKDELPDLLCPHCSSNDIEDGRFILCPGCDSVCKLEDSSLGYCDNCSVMLQDIGYHNIVKNVTKPKLRLTYQLYLHAVKEAGLKLLSSRVDAYYENDDTYITATFSDIGGSYISIAKNYNVIDFVKGIEMYDEFVLILNNYVREAK